MTNNESLKKIEQELSAIRKTQEEIKNSQSNIQDTLISIENNQENFRESLASVISIQGDILKEISDQKRILEKVVDACVLLVMHLRNEDT